VAEFLELLDPDPGKPKDFDDRLPGVSVPARLVSTVREAAAERMYRSLAEAAAGADAALPYRLLGLLQVPDGQRISELERLRRSPTRTSGRAMTTALDRVSAALSAFAASEFQAVQFMPAVILPQLLLCGLLLPREQMQTVLRWVSDVLPLSYAVNAMSRVTITTGVPNAVLADLAIVLGCIVAALGLGAATLRRRTA